MSSSYVVLTKPTTTYTVGGSIGIVSVASVAARDLIPLQDRIEGMLVYVTEQQLTYQLVGGLSNSQWKPLIGAGSGSDVRRYLYQKGDTSLVINNVSSIPMVQCYYIAIQPAEYQPVGITIDGLTYIDNQPVDQSSDIPGLSGDMIFGQAVFGSTAFTSTEVPSEKMYVDISLAHKYIPSQQKLVVYTPVIYDGVVVVTF